MGPDKGTIDWDGRWGDTLDKRGIERLDDRLGISGATGRLLYGVNKYLFTNSILQRWAKMYKLLRRNLDKINSQFKQPPLLTTTTTT